MNNNNYSIPEDEDKFEKSTKKQQSPAQQKPNKDLVDVDDYTAVSAAKIIHTIPETGYSDQKVPAEKDISIEDADEEDKYSEDEFVEETLQSPDPPQKKKVQSPTSSVLPASIVP